MFQLQISEKLKSTSCGSL